MNRDDAILYFQDTDNSQAGRDSLQALLAPSVTDDEVWLRAYMATLNGCHAFSDGLSAKDCDKYARESADLAVAAWQARKTAKESP